MGDNDYYVISVIREEEGRRVGRVCGGIDDVTMEGRARWTSMSHQRGYRVVGEGQGGEEEEERKAVITYYVIRRPLGDTAKPAHCFMWCRVYGCASDARLRCASVAGHRCEVVGGTEEARVQATGSLNSFIAG